MALDHDPVRFQHIRRGNGEIRADACPAGTVTLGGVATSPSRLPLSGMTAPPAGAGAVRVTVPVVVVPPSTLD